MKRILSVCIGLLLIAAFAYADAADRAPAANSPQIDLKEKAAPSSGIPTFGKGAGGPDAYGFRWIDSDEAGGPAFNWIDITSTGTELVLTDDGEINIASPFPITFYGVTSTDLRVGNNGGILFNATAGDVSLSNYALPSRYYGLQSILPFIDDLDVDSGGVYWEVQGTAPNRQLIVEWYNRVHYSISGGATFEVVFYEGREEVLFQYLDVDFGNASYNNGISATVGIQGDSVAAANWFLQYSHLTASLHDNLAIKFFTYVPQAGDLALQSIDEPSGSYMAPDQVFTPTATVSNPGTTPVSNFQVVFDIDDGTTKALVYTDTVDVAGPLDPGNTVQASFDGFTPQGLSNYYVTAYVSASGDPYAENDTIHAYFRTFNELQGNVTDDNAGGAGLAGATITAAGPATYVTTTDGSGDYFFFDMAAGTYNVTASRTGYINETMTGVSVVDGAQTQLDLSMGYPVLTLTPTDSIYCTLPWGGYDNTTWQFTLENTGTRDMSYSVIWPEVVKGGKALGDSLFGFTVNHIASLGIEVAAGYIWVTSGGVTSNADGNYFLRYNFSGNFVDSLAQGTTSTWGYRDMAFDGTYLYCGDENSAGIRQINPATGAYTGTTVPFSASAVPRALAYNPDNDHFYTANFSSSIWEVSRTGTLVNTWANTKAIYGLAYDGTNPAGPSLWVWSQDGTPACQASRFDLTTGVYGSETWQGTAIDPASGLAGGATITDQVVPGYLTLLGFIQDTPDRGVAYELRALSCDWLNISPNSGTVPAYDSELLEVTFDAAGLDSLTDHAANVTFNTNAMITKRTDYVPAYLHVVGTGVSGGPSQPLSYAFGLNANRPNPVSGRTSFSFTLPRAQDYSLKVYNVSGQLVESFAGKGQAGANSVSWNAQKAGAGVYLYRLSSGGQSATRKLVVIK
jgi:hypothetical protein